MNHDQINLIRQLRSQGQTIEQIAGQVGVEMGDVQTAVTMLDFLGSDSNAASPLRVVTFPFAFDTPGLTSGVPFYTPTPGDLLLDAWFEVDEAWDGTTPQGDIGTFVGSAVGLFGFTQSTVGLGAIGLDTEPGGAGVLVNPIYSSLGRSGARSAPAKFTAANPLKLVVSQDGTAGGLDPGATQGKATLYLLVMSP